MRTLVLLALALGCAHADPAALHASLLKADADFARDVAARGTEAWVDAFAADGAMFTAGRPPIRGKEQIGEAMAALGDPRKAPPQLQLRWRPLAARVSDDGTLGWTYGNAVAVSPDGERQSKYLTIWRRQPDGSWKVEADQGTPGWADPSSPP